MGGREGNEGEKGEKEDKQTYSHLFQRENLHLLPPNLLLQLGGSLLIAQEVGFLMSAMGGGRLGTSDGLFAAWSAKRREGGGEARREREMDERV